MHVTTLHTSFKFDTIVVLDSLPSGEEPQTAHWLRNHVLPPLSDSTGVGVVYCRVESRGELIAALACIENAVRGGVLAPILHFESHGVEQGMVLANREIVPWLEIKPWLTHINRASHMNLLSIMSMCHGWHLVSQLQPVEAAPVWALIGPIHPVLPARLQDALQTFYPILLNTLNGREAAEAMNVGRSNSELKVETAEIMFCKVWRSYEENACSTDELRSREDRIVVTMLRQSGYDLRSVISRRAVVQERLRQNEEMFGRYRRSFLMLDLFPENECRFPITYRQCVEAA